MIAYDVNQKLDDGQASSPRADARNFSSCLTAHRARTAERCVRCISKKRMNNR